jgi:methylated-DNA-[protein]-cysteine S-methyltransferase
MFPLEMLDWSVVYPFQRRVLRMEYRIPHGMVSTYGRLAHKLGHARAARAVGTALARNPFPVAIPCHRAIRVDRSLGGYAGGLAMKRRLLELEGLQFDRYGRVMTERLW